MSIFYFNTQSDYDSRREQIKDILNRGKIAVFTHKYTGAVKKVNEWTENEDGDLIAFESTGLSHYVGWGCPIYDISEE